MLALILVLCIKLHIRGGSVSSFSFSSMSAYSSSFSLFPPLFPFSLFKFPPPLRSLLSVNRRFRCVRRFVCLRFRARPRRRLAVNILNTSIGYLEQRRVRRLLCAIAWQRGQSPTSGEQGQIARTLLFLVLRFAATIPLKGAARSFCASSMSDPAPQANKWLPLCGNLAGRGCRGQYAP
jgi:hypothetical protein